MEKEMRIDIVCVRERLEEKHWCKRRQCVCERESGREIDRESVCV
jgi:hypothetical protein